MPVDNVQMRKCNKCKEAKPLSAFYKDSSRPQGHGYRCKPCHNKSNPGGKAKYQQPHVYDRDAFLVRKYGITAMQYAEMLFLQGGVCKICRRDGGDRKLRVDHNHETGEVRGLLCHSCNTGIGLLQDDPEVLQAAIDYLRGN